jgi:hypothetical protein
MTTHEQMKHAVATALSDMGRDPDLRGQLLTAAEVARRSNVHIGHVREIMRAEFGLKFDAGPQESFGWSRQKYEAIEAYALIPISRGAPMVKSQVFNIGTNHGQVVAGDNHGDFMLSVSHHLEQVVRAWNGPEKVDGVLV